eukprot:NODE_282_length_11867_cov_0.266995.p6 type:complete len:117 gc:universal NODE_282_length_11867_cov_0.266995:6275-5925(-)
MLVWQYTSVAKTHSANGTQAALPTAEGLIGFLIIKSCNSLPKIQSAGSNVISCCFICLFPRKDFIANQLVSLIPNIIKTACSTTSTLAGGCLNDFSSVNVSFSMLLIAILLASSIG